MFYLTVRLVDGDASNRGRVEIFYHGVWGTICDDFWDLRDATVVCWQLGFKGALAAPHNAVYGQGKGVIWMDDVKCTGNETALSQCGHKGWRVTECGHWEDASVICIPPGKKRQK